MNIIDVSQEHYFSNITQEIMSQLNPYINTKEKNSYSCVSLSVSGEFHNIGVHMVTDLLDAEGWNTYYLGSDIPTQNVIRAIQDRKANMLIISATMCFNLDSVSNLIKGVRSLKGCENVKIMVGGRAVNINKKLWKLVDADEVRKLAEESSTAVQRIQEVTGKVQKAFQNLSNSAKDILEFIDNKVKPDYVLFVDTSKQYGADAIEFNNLSTNIGDSMNIVNDTVSEIKNAIENVSATAEESVASSEEILASVNESVMAIQEIAKASQNQAILAEKLNVMVQKFKL